MDSDDDYQSFSPPEDQSPQVNYRRLKRLKKSTSRPPKHHSPQPIDDPLLFSSVDFAKLEALENGSETLDDYNESNSSQESLLSPGTGSDQQIEEEEEEEEEENELPRGTDEVFVIKKTKRVLEFDDDVAAAEGDGVATGDNSEGFAPERVEEKDLFERMKVTKKKRTKKNDSNDDLMKKNDSGDDSKKKDSGSNKRREEKERKAYLEELHAESQRLLRETRDATFKPVPMVQKPISSVLEKIRKRKLEIAKKAMIANDRSYSCEGNKSPRERTIDLDISNGVSDELNVEKTTEEITDPPVDEQSSLDASNVDGQEDALKQSLNEVHTPAFRAPVEDTQDLFDDSEPITAEQHDKQHDKQPSSPLDEDFAPSLLAMNLKLDSAPADDSYSDEEDSDKENIDPHLHGVAGGRSSPKGDPVKDFVDEEAEEEDDSDNDLGRFQENEEDENNEDIEELNDMIATEYEEKSIDNERRNELHQKWLEQQDATGTENLLQRLKCGPELRDTLMLDKESETDEDDDELDDEGKGDSLFQCPARVNTKKAKQIILQLFADKEDIYVSDDEGDTHRTHAQRLRIRKEEQATLVSPADDESSREVFGLIKKLNIESGSKKKPKASSFFDSVGVNSNSSSKSSFLGRVSNHSIQSSHKQGSGTFRSFIFGRDDSNSRSASVSMSEDSSDTASQEIRSTRTATAKFSGSQTKFSNQTRNSAAETVAKTSLLEILKRSSSQSRVCNHDSTVDLTKSILAFRVPKKPMKIEGRS